MTKIRDLEKEFNNRIEGLNRLGIDAKIEKKKKQDRKISDCLDLCKKHGGPLTSSDEHRLDILRDDEVLAEAKYYKEVHNSAVRFKRKIDEKFVKFTISELRQQLRDVILLSGEPIVDNDELLKSALKS